MVKYQRASPVACVTCGQKSLGFKDIELPEGYGLECDKCRVGSPGKPMKTVRTCSMCRESIIVMGVPGGVRLTCNACAKKDPKLIQVEALINERDKYREALNDAQAEDHVAIRKLEELEIKFETEVAARVQAVVEENSLLKLQIRQSEENSLTSRIQAKMRMKYGETEKQRLEDFAAWLLTNRGWTEGNEKVELPDLVEHYVRAEVTDG